MEGETTQHKGRELGNGGRDNSALKKEHARAAEGKE